MKVQIEFFTLQNLCKYCHAVTKCLHPHNLTLLYGRSWGECTVDDCPFCVEDVDNSELQGDTKKLVRDKWITIQDCERQTRTYICPICGEEKRSWWATNYCENCGEKMEVEE